jgi:hypothetical protein
MAQLRFGQCDGFIGTPECLEPRVVFAYGAEWLADSAWLEGPVDSPARDYPDCVAELRWD